MITAPQRRPGSATPGAVSASLATLGRTGPEGLRQARASPERAHLHFCALAKSFTPELRLSHALAESAKGASRQGLG